MVKFPSLSVVTVFSVPFMVTDTPARGTLPCTSITFPLTGVCAKAPGTFKKVRKKKMSVADKQLSRRFF
jgi:hypothetical protein